MIRSPFVAADVVIVAGDSPLVSRLARPAPGWQAVKVGPGAAIPTTTAIISLLDDAAAVRRLVEQIGGQAVKLVHLSSVSIYGPQPDAKPVGEDHPLQPAAGWAPAVEQVEAERLLAELRRAATRTPVVVLRAAVGAHHA